MTTTATLLPHHQELIRASAISDDVARERGYRSIGTAESRDMGFTGGQAGYGLLVPRWNVWGEQDGYQLRRDEPRLNRDGKPIRYETPRGQLNALDVHPSMRERVRSPREAIFVTEGVRKGDCLASLDIPTISLAGVWSWRGVNERGGKTAVPDWQDINIAGSIFVLAFDRDILTKPAVHAALSALRDYLTRRGAFAVRVLMLPDGHWKGVDDWIGALREVVE